METAKQLLLRMQLSKELRKTRINMKKTMFDKIWHQHVITGEPGEPQLIYVDLQLLHEVTSPQAFEGLREKIVRSDGRIEILPQWITMFPRSIFSISKI